MTTMPAELYPAMCDAGVVPYAKPRLKEYKPFAAWNDDRKVLSGPSVIGEENPPGLSSAIARSTGARKELT
jgi:hypothetical protein